MHRGIRFAIVMMVTVLLAAGAATAAELDNSDPVPEGIDDPRTAVENESQESNVIAASSSSGTPGTTGTDVAVVLSATERLNEFDAKFPTNGTIDVWLGAFNNTVAEPVSGEELTVTIQRPDDSEETFNTTTDGNGSAYLEYDLSEPGRESGTYSLQVESSDPDGGSASVTFEVGVDVQITTESFDGGIAVGEETTISMAARDGDTPETGVELDVTVTRSSQLIVDKTVETDADGFANVTFTPNTTGNYRVTVQKNNSETQEAFEIFESSEIFGDGTFAIGEAKVDDQNFYGTYLQDSNGPLSNTDVEVRVVNDPSSTDPTEVVNRTVTTDQEGFLGFEYAIDDPSLVDEFLEVEAETADGRPILLQRQSIDVNEAFAPPISDPGPDPDPDPDPVEFSAFFQDFDYNPGSTANVSIQATNGSMPINETVDVVVRYDFDGPPYYVDTVSLGSDGMATVRVPIDENAPNGVELDGTVSMEYKGEQYSSSLFSRISAVNTFISARPIEPGEESTLRLSATTGGGQTPVEGVLSQVDVQSQPILSSLQTERLKTNASGVDSVTVDIPDDVGFQIGIGQYDRDSSFTRDYRVAHPGNLSVPDSVDVGDTLDATVNTPNNEDLYGIVFLETGSPRQTIGGTLDGSDSVSIEIPPGTKSAGFSGIEVWAADASGQLYRDSADITIVQPVNAIFAFGPENPTVGETVTFDASQASSDDGNIVEYRWDFDGDGTIEETTTDPVTQHTFDDNGTVSTILEVEDETGQTAQVRRSVEVESLDGLTVSIEPQSAVVVAGNETTQYNVTVENVGTRNYTQNISFTVENETGQTVNSSTVETTLSPGETETLSFTVPTDDPAAVPVGSYDVLAASENVTAIADLLVAATDQANFNLSSAALTNEFADASIPEGEVSQGENVTVSMNVTNLGAGGGSDNVTFELTDADGNSIVNDTLTLDLGAGNKTTVTAEVTPGTGLDAGGTSYTYSFALEGGNATVSDTISLHELGDVDHSGSAGPLDAANTLRHSQGLDPTGNTFNPAAGAVSGEDTSAFNAAQVLRLSQGLEPTVNDWEVDTTLTLTTEDSDD